MNFKKLVSTVLVSTLIAGAIALAPLSRAHADCVTDGDVSNADVVVCDSAPNDTDGVDTGADDDHVTVNADATVSNSDSTIVTGEGNDTVVNNGTINSDWNGIDDGTGTYGPGDEVYINNGTINAGNTGIQDYSDGTDYAENNGTITVEGGSGGGFYGVYNGSSGDTTTVNNGDIVVNATSGHDGTGDYDYDGNDTFTNNGNVDVNGDYLTTGIEDLFDGSDTYINNGSFNVQGGGGDAYGIVDGGGTNVIENNGTLSVVSSNGADDNEVYGIQVVGYDEGLTYIHNADGALIEALATENGTGYGIYGDNTVMSFYIVNDGTITGSTDAIVLAQGDDTVILNNGSTVNGSIITDYGDDTVKLGSSSANYSVVCGDIKSVTLAQVAPVVNGSIDAGELGNDTLVIGLFGETSSITGNGTFEIGGQTYSVANFENVQFTSLSYSAGATRLYDDGEVLAFTSKDGNGIDICSGPMGFRAATIDFATLDENANGQVFAAGNEGWFVRVYAVGGEQYRVQVFDGNGVMQNDEFTFTH